MTSALRTADRVESFIAAVDGYEPTLVAEHADAFRLFARFVSRSLDGRYLERHPPQELLPDIDQMMACVLSRHPDELKVRVLPSDNGTARRGVLVTCMPDQPFIYSVVRMAFDTLGLRTYRSMNTIVPV